jgi:uncharacterized protein YkwD
VGNVRAVLGRRPSPALLLLAFLILCLAPLGVAAATGLGDRVGGGDDVETAEGEPVAATGDRDGGGDPAGGEAAGDEDSSPSGGGVRAQAGRRSPPPTGMADVPPSDRTTTTTAAAPPATEGGPTTAPAPEPAPPPAPPTTVTVQVPLSDQVVALVNAARAAAATPCPPVTVDPRLTAAAQGHSDDMAARNYFSHTTPEGVTFDQRIKAAGYPLPGAENIAKGQRSAQQVMNSWMGSDGHRRNIENCRLTAIGVGVNTSAWTWTQDFGY